MKLKPFLVCTKIMISVSVTEKYSSINLIIAVTPAKILTSASLLMFWVCPNGITQHDRVVGTVRCSLKYSVKSSIHIV